MNDFEVKDNGKREEFASGMMREPQNDKMRPDLALDGPLFWSLFDETSYCPLVRTAGLWYEFGGLDHAAALIQELAKLEGGLFALFDRYTQLMMRGAVKYSEQNWMKAAGEAEAKRFRASFGRHLIKYLRGEKDEDHAAAIWFNVNGAEYVHLRLHPMDGPLPF